METEQEEQIKILFILHDIRLLFSDWGLVLITIEIQSIQRIFCLVMYIKVIGFFCYFLNIIYRFGTVLLKYSHYKVLLCDLKKMLNTMVWFMVFNATFNNISVISWQPFLLVEETGVP